jgi:hypothetical protein
MDKKKKIAIALGVTGIASAIAYYFFTVRKTNQNAIQATANIQEALQTTKVPPSQYEGKAIRPLGRNEIYIVQNGLKRWVPSREVLQKYGFDFGQEITLPLAVVDALPTGGSLAGLARFQRFLR